MGASVVLFGFIGLLIGGLPGILIGALAGIPIYFGIMGVAMMVGYSAASWKMRHVLTHDKRRDRILNKR